MADDSWNLTPDDAQRRLQMAYGIEWMIWYVPLAVGGLTWCAKRHADGALVHAAQPDHLAEYIAAANEEMKTLRDSGWR